MNKRTNFRPFIGLCGGGRRRKSSQKVKVTAQSEWKSILFESQLATDEKTTKLRIQSMHVTFLYSDDLNRLLDKTCHLPLCFHVSLATSLVELVSSCKCIFFLFFKISKFSYFKKIEHHIFFIVSNLDYIILICI